MWPYDLTAEPDRQVITLPLASTEDVTNLPPRTSPTEISQRFNDDVSFNALCLAEAICPGDIPPGVSRWLLSNLPDWRQVLVFHDGYQQIKWWEAIMRGDSTAAQREKAKLDAIRSRQGEVRDLLAGKLATRTRSAAETKAIKQLWANHQDEAERMRVDLSAQSGLQTRNQITPPVQRLLDLGDQDFIRLVHRDVLRLDDIDELGHYKLLHRWYRALEKIGCDVFTTLGLKHPPLPVADLFHVGDELLRRLPPGQAPFWIPHLEFLCYLRVRLSERARMVQERNLFLSTEVFLPIEDHLRATYFTEYSRYRLAADEALKEAS